MSCKLLVATPVIAAVEEQLRQGVVAQKKRTGHAPKLSVILVGSDPASQVYVGKKQKTAQSLGFESETLRFPETTPPAEIQKAVARLNADPLVHGILIQRPLPKSYQEDQVMLWVAPEKDVDAFHPENVGRISLGNPRFLPCTPAGIIELLKFYQVPMAGKTACVVGRSSIVGKPMGQLLLQENATLIQTHSRTQNLAHFTRQADLLVVAAGKPEMITADHVKSGAVVVDVGIHRKPDGKLMGDVHAESVMNVASALTPVPGGVGPMTIAMLLKNTLNSAAAAR